MYDYAGILMRNVGIALNPALHTALSWLPIAQLMVNSSLDENNCYIHIIAL